MAYIVFSAVRIAHVQQKKSGIFFCVSLARKNIPRDGHIGPQAWHRSPYLPLNVDNPSPWLLTNN